MLDFKKTAAVFFWPSLFLFMPGNNDFEFYLDANGAFLSIGLSRFLLDSVGFYPESGPSVMLSSMITILLEFILGGSTPFYESKSDSPVTLFTLKCLSNVP